jgi:hypothetical protein
MTPAQSAGAWQVLVGLKSLVCPLCGAVSMLNNANIDFLHSRVKVRRWMQAINASRVSSLLVGIASWAMGVKLTRREMCRNENLKNWPGSFLCDMRRGNVQEIE